MLALGIKVQDKVTGFKGTVIGAYIALTGCTRYDVQPSLDKENQIPKSEWFDETRLIITDDIPVLQDPAKTPTGPGPG